LDQHKPTTVFIGLGSNLGDGMTTLQQAWQEVGKADDITICSLSSPFLSAPVGMESSNWFTNSMGKLETLLSPIDLLDALMKVETSFGRRRDDTVEGYQDRTLDLDVIYFGKSVINSRRLTLPHPFLARRLFVLEPLAEIAAHFVDPIDGMTPVQKLDTLKKQMNDGLVPLQEITKGRWP